MCKVGLSFFTSCLLAVIHFSSHTVCVKTGATEILTKAGEFKYVVMIVTRQPNGSNILCSGIILNERFVLTCARCMSGYIFDSRVQKRKLTVRAGTTYVPANWEYTDGHPIGPVAIERHVKRFITPSRYFNAKDSDAILATFVILELDEPLDLNNERLERAKLARIPQNDSARIFQFVGIGGTYYFGMSSYDGRQRKTNMTMLDESTSTFTNRTFFAVKRIIPNVYNVSLGLFNFDQGGPLIRDDQTVAGIASGSKYPDQAIEEGKSLFISLDFHKDLIEAAINTPPGVIPEGYLGFEPDDHKVF